VKKLTLSRRTLRRVARGAGIAVGCVVLFVGLYLLGRQVTPAGATRPVIYSPSVRRTEGYRRRARAWLGQLSALDEELVAVATSNRVDVYALSEAGNVSLDKALRLSQAVSLVYPPASLVSLQNGLQEAADLYLDAAVAVNLWVGEPTPESYFASLEAIRLARHTRTAVEANPWLAAPAEPSPELPDTPGSPVAQPTPGWGQ
jgi:hypothetical protein